MEIVLLNKNQITILIGCSSSRSINKILNNKIIVREHLDFSLEKLEGCSVRQEVSKVERIISRLSELNSCY